MPPALEPLDSQIVDAVVVKLKTGLDPVNFYFANIPTVEKEEDNLFVIRDFPAVFVIQGDMSFDEQIGGGAAGYFSVTMDLVFVCMLNTHENASRDIARLRADILKLLMADQQVNGLALDSTISSSASILIEADEPLQYMELTGTYKFRMFKTDPTLSS